MENKTYALICVDECGCAISISTSKDVDKLVAKMKEEYDTELSCLGEIGIEIGFSNFLSENKEAFINYGRYCSYFWEIKEIVNLD